MELLLDPLVVHVFGLPCKDTPLLAERLRRQATHLARQPRQGSADAVLPTLLRCDATHRYLEALLVCDNRDVMLFINRWARAWAPVASLYAICKTVKARTGVLVLSSMTDAMDRLWALVQLSF